MPGFSTLCTFECLQRFETPSFWIFRKIKALSKVFNPGYFWLDDDWNIILQNIALARIFNLWYIWMRLRYRVLGLIETIFFPLFSILDIFYSKILRIIKHFTVWLLCERRVNKAKFNFSRFKSNRDYNIPTRYVDMGILDWSGERRRRELLQSGFFKISCEDALEWYDLTERERRRREQLISSCEENIG